MRDHLHLPFLVLLNLLLCATSYLYASILPFSEIKIEETPSKIDYPDASAIYLLREGEYRIQKTSTFSEHMIIKILDEGGKRHANIRIPFWEGCKFLDLKARTIRADGKVINIDKNDFYEVTNFPEYVLYANLKAKVFTFPAVDVGCILEYTYTLGYKAPYVPIWYFQADEPTQLAKFTYDVPVNFGFDYYISSLPNISVDKTVGNKGDRRKATFTLKDLPAIALEPLSPPINDISAWIMMAWASFRYFSLELRSGGRTGLTMVVDTQEVRSGLETWFDIGKSYSAVTDTLLEPNKTIKTKAEELTQGCVNDEAKIGEIYKFIRDNCRYVAVEIKGHGAIPNAPEMVLKNQYGDCKDLSGLLVSLLRSVGIEAHLVLVKTKSAGKFIERFPAVAQINHVIVAVALKHFIDTVLIKDAITYGMSESSIRDDFVIIDPSTPTFPLGKLNSEIQGRKAVLCAGHDSELMTLQTPDFKTNLCLNTIVFKFDSTTYSGSIQIKLEGEEAARLRYQLLHLKQSAIRDFFQKYVSNFPLKIELDTFNLLYLRDFDSSLTIDLRFKGFSRLQTVGKQIIIPAMFKSSPQFNDIYACDKRTHNIEFDYSYLRNDIIKIVIPKNYKLSSLPEKESVKNEWCEYMLSAYTCGDTIMVSRNIAVEECVIPSMHASEIREFSAKVLDSSQKVVTISRRQ